MNIVDIALMSKVDKCNYLKEILNINLFYKFVCCHNNNDLKLLRINKIKALNLQAKVYFNISYLINNYDNKLDFLLFKLQNNNDIEILNLIIKEILKYDFNNKNIDIYNKLNSSIKKENFYGDINIIELLNSYLKNEIDSNEYEFKYKEYSNLINDKYSKFMFNLPLVLNNNSTKSSEIVDYLMDFIKKRKEIKFKLKNNEIIENLDKFFILDNEIVNKVINWNSYIPTDGAELKKTNNP